ncbi:MAG: DinB family protein [Gemmatimonadota bacterium]|nr:DinB family protein [Gemmatimonadota bacterium]
MTSTATHPETLHPRIQEVLDYLEVHRRQLLDTIASVPAKIRETRPGEGQWSVAEVVEHLALIESRVAGLLTMKVSEARANGVGADAETSSVVASFKNPDSVIDRTNKIVAPTATQPSGSLDTDAGTQALEKSRAAMVGALHNANGVSLEHLMQPHPILGAMNMYHWMVATALHDDRHALQIREIRQTLAGS